MFKQVLLATALVVSTGAAVAPASAAPALGKASENAIYAQTLVNEVTSKHPELLVLGMHAQKPGAKGSHMIAANLDRIGVDNVMFESDYPHSDSNWPHAREMLAKSLADTPDDVARKIAEDNARRVYNFPRL